MGRHRLELFRGVGQGIGPCRIGFDGKSSFVFASLPAVPPSCAVKKYTNPEVKGSRSAKPNATASIGPQAGRWRGALLEVASHSSFPRRRESILLTMDPGFRGDDGESHYRGNKARMYMKTKEKYKKSGSADRRFCGLRHFRDPWQRAADRKHGGPRYIKIERTIRECL